MDLPVLLMKADLEKNKIIGISKHQTNVGKVFSSSSMVEENTKHALKVRHYCRVFCHMIYEHNFETIEINPLPSDIIISAECRRKRERQRERQREREIVR